MPKLKLIYLVVIFSVSCFIVGCAGRPYVRTGDLPPCWPTGRWQASTPEQQGMDSDVLAKALDYIKRQNLSVHSLLIIRHGYVILDAYFYPYTGESAHDLASVTKSITASLVGLALEKGYLRSLEQPVLNFFPERTVDNSSVNKGHLRIKDLLAMSSGLKCGYGPAEPELFAMLKSKDWVQFALDLPMVTKPGTEFSY